MGMLHASGGMHWALLLLGLTVCAVATPSSSHVGVPGLAPTNLKAHSFQGGVPRMPGWKPVPISTLLQTHARADDDMVQTCDASSCRCQVSYSDNHLITNSHCKVKTDGTYQAPDYNCQFVMQAGLVLLYGNPWQVQDAAVSASDEVVYWCSVPPTSTAAPPSSYHH